MFQREREKSVRLDGYFPSCFWQYCLSGYLAYQKILWSGMYSKNDRALFPSSFEVMLGPQFTQIFSPSDSFKTSQSLRFRLRRQNTAGTIA